MIGFKMRSIFGCSLLTGILLLAGCTGLGNVPPAAQQLDLGAPRSVVGQGVVAGKAKTVLVLPPLDAVSALQGMSVIWRMGAEGVPNRYASYVWAASPESLVRERLTARLSADYAVLSNSLDSQELTLRINLMQFEQIYAPDGASNQGVVSFQALLLQGSQVLGQYRDTVSVTGERNDATAGAVALRIATDTMADKLDTWIKSIPLPKH